MLSRLPLARVENVVDWIRIPSGEPAIMNAALDRLKSGGMTLTETDTFKWLFPKTKGEIVEAHALSLSDLIRMGLGLVPDLDPAILAAIPDQTAGLAGYSVMKGGNLIGLDRISLSEIEALQKAFAALSTAMPAVAKQLGIPMMPPQTNAVASPMPMGVPDAGASGDLQP